MGNPKAKLQGLIGKLVRKIKSLDRSKAGCFPVYVGEEKKRYNIPTSYLSSTMFKALMNKYVEESKMMSDKPITLPCSVWLFEHVLNLVKAEETEEKSNLPSSIFDLIEKPIVL